MKKVTGIGGIFFKSKDPEAAMQWYAQHLGLTMESYGSNFEWREADHPEKTGNTLWSVMPSDTGYFAPSDKEFMINFRVENIENLVALLKAEGISVLDEIEASEYGKFVHIMDPDGVKIELWEPPLVL